MEKCGQLWENWKLSCGKKYPRLSGTHGMANSMAGTRQFTGKDKVSVDHRFLARFFVAWLRMRKVAAWFLFDMVHVRCPE